MDTLRKPFFLLALILLGVIVLMELGTTAVLPQPAASPDDIARLLPPDEEVREAYLEMSPQDRLELGKLLSQKKPPGRAIRALALVDGILLFTVGLMGLGLLWGARIHGRVQGGLTLVFALLLLLAAIAMALAALAALMIMLALLAAVPFGTLAYLALYGFFNRAGAAALLGVILLLKAGAVVALALAQPRFLQNKGLDLMILTSFLAMMIISFLHGLVPGFLVSITDAIAAIIVGILAGVWCVFLLVGSIRALIRMIPRCS
jgi:hypothetical protein